MEGVLNIESARRPSKCDIIHDTSFYVPTFGDSYIPREENCKCTPQQVNAVSSLPLYSQGLQ